MHHHGAGISDAREECAMAVSKVHRPSGAVLIAASALVIAVYAAVVALGQPASASTRTIIGPYVVSIDVHDVTGEAIHLDADQAGSAQVGCPPGQILVGGGFESHGSFAKLDNVESITSSHPVGSFSYTVPKSNGLDEIETAGPRFWTITAVDPGVAQPVALLPYASCLEFKLGITATSSH